MSQVRDAGNVVIAGPGWNGRVPSDVDQTYRCSTRYAWILVQMAAAGPQDFDEIHAMQDELACDAAQRLANAV